MSTVVAPILKTIVSFDATKDKVIEFSLDRMNRIPSSMEVIIKNNETDEIVFSDTVAIGVGSKNYTILANSLINNVRYKCSIIVYDPSGVPSPESNSVRFYCIETPRFNFLNVPYQLNDSYLNVEMEYLQTGLVYDPLQSFYIEMINSKSQLFFKSDVYYIVENNIPSIEIFNIEENEGYIITAYGETLNGLAIEVSQELFVQFSRPSSFSALILNNMYDRGNIRIVSNIKGLQGDVIGEEIYIDNEKIDLSKEGNEVLFQKGFEIKSEFYLKMAIEKLQPNLWKPFLEIFQDDKHLQFYFRQSVFKCNNNESKVYVELVQDNGVLKHIIKSNYITPLEETEQLFVGIKKVDAGNGKDSEKTSYYQIAIANKGDV